MNSIRNALFASLLSGGAPPSAGAVASTGLLLEPFGSMAGLADPEPLAELEEETRTLLAAHGIDAVVSSRHKSLVSTALKMRRKGIGAEGVVDRLGVRVIVDTVEACYRVRSLLQAEHAPLLDEQDDYISSPKANGYQSLHAALRTRLAGVVEFQVRTFAMHEHAEHGPASHATYKILQVERALLG